MMESLKSEVKKIFRKNMAAILVIPRVVMPKGRRLARCSSEVPFSCPVGAVCGDDVGGIEDSR